MSPRILDAVSNPIQFARTTANGYNNIPNKENQSI